MPLPPPSKSNPSNSPGRFGWILKPTNRPKDQNKTSSPEKKINKHIFEQHIRNKKNGCNQKNLSKSFQQIFKISARATYWGSVWKPIMMPFACDEKTTWCTKNVFSSCKMSKTNNQDMGQAFFWYNYGSTSLVHFVSFQFLVLICFEPIFHVFFTINPTSYRRSQHVPTLKRCPETTMSTVTKGSMKINLIFTEPIFGLSTVHSEWYCKNHFFRKS